jgi:hypothetical protein
MSFKLVTKNGDTTYKMKNGVYKSKLADRVEEFDTLAEALGEFLYLVNDEYTEEKVSLIFSPKKAKSKD